MQKINLYVDDIRSCPEGFKLARTFEEALEIIKSNELGLLSVDHDLGEDENGKLLPTGYDLVKAICENGINVEAIYLHTDNPVGRENMYQTLLGAQKRGFIDEAVKIFRYPYPG